MNRKTPEYYVKRRKELNDRYYLLLHEITALFPKHKANPDSPTYSTEFITDTGNMNKLQSDFFLLRNGLEKNISSLGGEIRQVDSKISKIEKENKNMSGKVRILKSGGNAALGMFNDTQLIYNQQVFGNLLLGGAIAGVGVIYYKSRA
jgi:hypothetical protein